MVIYLAGLQGVPNELYESAELDGASWPRKIWNITIPMISPVIFFNLIMGLIGSFQYFTQAYIMTSGGPMDSTLFYSLSLYNNAFRYYKMGYASAQAWVLFVIILCATLLAFKTSSKWVFYGGNEK
jgi:multiple sugar transport system permease protein